MTFGQTELSLLVGYCGLWWLFYLFVRMRADRKYLRSDQAVEDKPCLGCLITQSAMLAAMTMAIGLGLYSMDLIGIK